jgi:RNA polymerase sigma-70 factor, ECF subfamily
MLGPPRNRMNNDPSSLPSTLADMAELGRLLEEHQPKLLAMVRRRLDPALAARLDAEDVLNEAYLLARRKWAAVKERPAGSLYAWLYRIVLDCLIEAWRRESRGPRDYRRSMPLPEGTSVQLALGLVNPATSPSAALAREELRARVRQVVEMLREKDREILWMRHADGLSYEEIAAVLGVEKGAAHTRYHRALGRLSDLWQQLHPESGGER